jgi:hypothetical protein
MDLFHLINSSEGLGSVDVDLDVSDGFRAFIGYLSAKILVASHSLAPATFSIASWVTFQLPIHHYGICKHPDMEDEFLTTLILLLTLAIFTIACAAATSSLE